MTSSLLDDRSVLPPGLCFELRQAFDRLEPHRGTADDAVLRELWRLWDEAEPWVGLVPELVELGFRYLDPAHHHTVRQFACAWLTLFPTPETMHRLGAVALAEDTPENVREQAVWSLGFRQARRQPESVQWSPEATQIADRALIELAHRAAQAGRIPFDNLPLALRHVQSPAWFELMARDLPFWGQAIEAFADPALGRALLDQFERIPQAHQLRASRLAAATLGEEAIAPMLQLAELRQGLTLELRLLAVALGGEAQLGQLEDALASSRFTDDARRRAKWHLEHPGRVPTVRGLQLARSTGLIPGAQRKDACAEAADDLGVLTAFQRHPEFYLYELWATMVQGCNDLDRARTLCTLRPEFRKELTDLHLHDLARRGRVTQVVAAAQTLESVEDGAYWLAIYGKPFMALELAATSRFNTPRVAVARTLALYRLGRPDLATRVLAEELPPGAVTSLEQLPTFPGDHERWMVEHHPDLDPATTALVRGMDAVVALGQPACEGSELDSFSFETVGALERWLARPIDGSTVYLAGEFPGDSKERHAEAILERGGRLVDGPFPGTHYYVMGLTCLVTTVAQLERQGTRRIRNEELGLSW